MADEVMEQVGSTGGSLSGSPSTESGAGAIEAGGGATEGSLLGSSNSGGSQNPGLGGGAAPSQGGESFVSIRDALKQYGFDPAGYQNDEAALRDLAYRARMAEEASRYQQWFQQNQADLQAYQQWKQQQAAQAQQAQQKKESWWKAPEWDPSWRTKIQKDPVTGKLIPAEGAPPDIVQKFMQAVDHQQSFLEKFAFDPVGAIRPGVEEIAREIAQQMVQQHLGGYKEQVYADSFVQQHSSWLHARDQQGNLVMGPNGKPALSPWGQRFAGYVQEAMAQGIGSEDARARYALRMVKADYMEMERQRALQLYQGEAQKNQVQTQAAQRTPQPSASLASMTNGEARAQNTRISLKDRMKQSFEANGVTDSDIMKTVAGAR